jgi:hypothetical protein
MLPATVLTIERITPGEGRIRACQCQRPKNERGRPVPVDKGDPHGARGDERRDSKTASNERAQLHHLGGNARRNWWSPLRVPCMRFVAHVLAPRVERVVHHEAMLELFVVVAKVVGEPE